MISRCSNPGCGVPFRYLSDGRLFPFPAGSSGLRVGKICWHWLCGQCAQRYTLVADASGKVSLRGESSSGAAA
ncbi:MAG TPA: hypothetical protein VFU76_04420 [Terriglobales bacterium]|nr:hypothetical protein [Terriglobales bacterium]